MGGGTVILFQPHHNGARKILFKPQDIAHLGPAPAIDRLVVIAHAADVLMRLRQKPQPKVLADVGVLILVHQNVAEPALILFQHIGVFLEDHHAMQQKIAKIGGVQSAQTFLILLIKLGPAVVEGRSLGRGHTIRRQRAVLPAVDDPGQKPRGPALFVDIGRRNQLFQQAQLVVGVQNGEVRLQPHQFRMPPQDLHRQRVERAHPRHALGHIAQHPAHPQAHLARGLVGEGHGQNFIRPGAVHVQQMHDAGRQRLGLAGAGARKHQNRAIQRLNRGTLCGVQIIEIGRRAGCHGPLRQRHGGLEGLALIPSVHEGTIDRDLPDLKNCSGNVRKIPAKTHQLRRKAPIGPNSCPVSAAQWWGKPLGETFGALPCSTCL